jgi:putative transposase
MTSTTRENDPHANRLRGGRISEPWRTYFVTKCVDGRRPILGAPTAAEIIIDSLVHVRNEGQIKLLAFVVMPDHYHAIFTLLPGEDLSSIMRRIGSFTANQIRKALGLRQGIWQDDGFHDHACRDDQDVLGLVEYLHHNPVRKGLVSEAAEWPFSSAHPSRRAVLDWDWWA